MYLLRLQDIKQKRKYGNSWTETKKLKEIVNVNPVLNESKTQLIGSVIYIDNFGNVVTNIKKIFFRC